MEHIKFIIIVFFFVTQQPNTGLGRLTAVVPTTQLDTHSR
jgi:hypothetical protein